MDPRDHHHYAQRIQALMDDIETLVAGQNTSDRRIIRLKHQVFNLEKTLVLAVEAKTESAVQIKCLERVLAAAYGSNDDVVEQMSEFVDKVDELEGTLAGLKEEHRTQMVDAKNKLLDAQKKQKDAEDALSKLLKLAQDEMREALKGLRPFVGIGKKDVPDWLN